MSESPFSLSGRTAVITGGYGVLGAEMADALAEAGARVALLGRNLEAADEAAALIRARGREAMGIQADVTDSGDVERARDEVESRWGEVDILVNAAGGNSPGATVGPAERFFDIDPQAIREVFTLNFEGTLLPSMVFGSKMADRGSGVIVNISSAAAVRPVTRVSGYGAAKAAVDHFTRWLAVELATKYGEGIRVNAIRPGFFLAEQNRALLVHDDGSYTDRGKTIIEHTPMGRFGEAKELRGAIVWLCSDAASFVTGSVIDVDGGFNAFAGV